MAALCPTEAVARRFGRGARRLRLSISEATLCARRNAEFADADDYSACSSFAFVRAFARAFFCIGRSSLPLMISIAS
jgi:hypothetical protein